MLKRLLSYLDSTRSIQLFQALRFGAQFLVGIILAKTTLSTSDIGLFDTFLFVTTSVSFFWVSGFISALLPLYPAKSETDKPKLLFNAFVAITVFNTLLVAALYLFAVPFFAKVYPEGPFPYLGSLLLFLLLNNPAFLVEYMLMLKHRTKTLAAYGTILFVLQIALVAVPVLLGYGLNGAIIGLVVIGGIKFLILCILLLRNTKPTLDFGFLKEHLHLAWPLALSIFVSGSGDLVDGYLVSSHFDRATFAIFRYGARELPIAMLLANAFSSSVVPKVAEDLQSALVFIQSRSRQMMHLLFPLSIILLLTSRYFYPIVFRPGFAASAPVFNIFLLLLVTRMLFPQSILNGLRQTRIILASAIIELTLNIAISIVLMHYYGIIGIAWGTVIAYFIDKAFLIIYNYYRNGIAPTQYIDFKIIGLYSLFLYAAYLVSIFC